MRRIAMLAVTTAVAGAAIAGPHLGLGAVPGISDLRSVRQLLVCDARALDGIGSGPASASAPAGCTQIAKTLAPAAPR